MGIGRVEDQRVDAGIGQALGVAAEDPGIVAPVVAEERLAPIMIHAHGAPQGRIRLAKRVGILAENSGDVVGAVPVGALP